MFVFWQESMRVQVIASNDPSPVARMPAESGPITAPKLRLAAQDLFADYRQEEQDQRVHNTDDAAAWLSPRQADLGEGDSSEKARMSCPENVSRLRAFYRKFKYMHDV